MNRGRMRRGDSLVNGDSGDVNNLGDTLLNTRKSVSSRRRRVTVKHRMRVTCLGLFGKLNHVEQRDTGEGVRV